MSEVYRELKKLFIIRKGFLNVPVKDIQKKIVEILDYELYAQMTPEDVEDAVNEVTTTEKFKRAILKNLKEQF